MDQQLPTVAEGCYAVIFTSVRTERDSAGYDATARRMVELAARQPGFLGIESARDSDGLGITVSYWSDREAIRHWREDAEHQMAQSMGRSAWYRQYRLRICRVEHEIAFERGSG
jgi:heme-degrading monooxygenase HmoA